MRNFLEEHRQSLIKIGAVILILGILYLFMTKLFSYIAPFVVAWIIASLLEPVIRFLQKRIKLPRMIAGIFGILFGLGIIGLAGTGIVIRIVQEANQFKQNLPAYINQVMIVIDEWKGKTSNLYIELPKSMQSFLDSAGENIMKALTSSVGPGVGKGSIGVVAFVPNLLLFTVVTLIATFFFINDRERIHSFVYKQLPKKWSQKLMLIKRALVGAFFGYIRAQLTLMVFTATICIIGLTIVGYEYSLLLGVVISIVDAFPVLGSGSILIPWAIWKGLMGDMKFALGLGIIYATVVLVRQTLEPKILGHHIGVYPLVTLMSMYIGVKIFGFIGIFLGPIIIILINTLQEMDVLPKWRI